MALRSPAIEDRKDREAFLLAINAKSSATDGKI